MTSVTKSVDPYNVIFASVYPEKTSVVLILISLAFGFIIGMNVNNHLQDHDCLKASTLYERAVTNFREDLHQGAGDELLISDELRKFDLYMAMTKVCHRN